MIERLRGKVSLALSLLVLANTALSATITVDSSDDGALGSITGECTLRAAVASANTATAVDGCQAGTAGGDEIEFDPGLTGSTITLVAGQVEISNDLTIAGPTPDDPSGITVDADEASRIFHIDDAGVDLRGMTLAGGKESESGGGAVFSIGAIVELRSMRLVENSAHTGGGLSVFFGELTLKDSEVSGNTATGDFGQGGGIHVDGSDVTVIGSTISDNHTEGEQGAGGGLFVFAAERPEIHVEVDQSEFLDNSTSGAQAHGGGLAVLSDESPAEVVISNSTISGNIVSGDFSRGGGVAVEGLPGFNSEIIAVDIMVRDTLIADNQTQGEEGSGGGISATLGDALVEYSTIAGNGTAGDLANGGGLSVDQGDAELVGSSVSGNTTSGSPGGGVHVSADQGEDGGGATLLHATVAYNTASGSVDGVFAARDLLLLNSLIVQAGAQAQGCNSPAEVHANSLVTDDSCTGTITAPTAIALYPLADNGGPTPTHRLDPDSIAIDGAGDCISDFGIERDQRGLPRPAPSSAACDVGSFESGADGIFSDRFE